MEPKAPQFSAYDFLGYLLPGLVLIALMDCTWLYHAKCTPLTWDYLAGRYSALKWQDTIPLVLFGYFLGHTVSFLSSFTVEEHARLMHGSPASFLVRETKPRYFDCGPWKWHRVLSNLVIVCIRFLMAVFMFPLCWIEWVFTRMVPVSRRYTFPISRLLKRCLTVAEDRFLDQMGVKTPTGKPPGRSKDELHWGLGFERLALHYALETAPAHLFTLRNYVVLYGFLRSMTFILLVVAWMIAGHLFLIAQFQAALLVMFFGGLVIAPSYGGFLKFWTRYHKEAMMAFLASMAQRKPSQGFNDKLGDGQDEKV